MTFIKGHPGYTPKQSEEHKRKKNLACSITSKGKHYSFKTEFKQGLKPWNKGKRVPSVTGDKNHQWKDESDVAYTSLHDWVARWKGKPKLCELCGTDKAKKYEWANIDHKYRRVLDDYIRMCTKCHRLYDKNRGIKIN